MACFEKRRSCPKTSKDPWVPMTASTPTCQHGYFHDMSTSKIFRTLSPHSELPTTINEPLYEIEESVVNSLEEPTGEYVVSIKSKMGKQPIQKYTVVEHFHQLMKETLGERLYSSLLKKGVVSKNLPDELITRKIMDALEMKNKLLFSGHDAAVSAIDKMNFIQAAGSFRGALRAAMSATKNVNDECLEGAATEGVMEYEGVFLKRDKPKPEIRVIGYVGITNLE